MGPRSEFLDYPDILDGDHGLIGEGLEKRDLLVREGTDLRSPDVYQPDWNSFSKHRRTEECSGSGTSGLHLSDIGIFRPYCFHHIVDVYSFAIKNRPSS